MSSLSCAETFSAEIRTGGLAFPIQAAKHGLFAMKVNPAHFALFE